MSTSPFAFDITDSGRSGAAVDQDSIGALTKFQADSRPSTTYVQQAAEQNRTPEGTPLTTLVQQAAEQNRAKDGTPPTTLVQQAAEQNNDTVIRNVEGLLAENFKAYDERPTNYVQQAAEQNMQARDGQYPGLGQFFRDDLEKNLIDNVSSVLARGNVMADIGAGRSPGLILGTVGELAMPDAKDFWHSGNEAMKVSKFVFQNFKAYGQEPETVVKGLAALEQQIDQNLLAANTGKPFVGQERDRMRQMAENAAMIKLAVAEYRQTSDPKGAEALVSGSGHSVNDLIRIASEHGANKNNMQQLKKMADEIAPP